MEVFRLSPQQRRLWLEQGGGPPALVRVTAHFAEGSDDGVRAAVERVVARHEILRTRFVRRPGFKVPFQAIVEAVEVSWDGAPLDFERGPVVAGEIVHRPDGGRSLALTLSALAADARSLELLAAEVGREINGGAAGETVQYADYAEWQNELLESNDEAAREARAWWSERKPIDPALPFELPAREGDPSWGEVSIQLPMAPRETLLAAWLLLLAKAGGNAEPRVAVTVDGRTHEETAGALGVFDRTLPVAVPIDGRPFGQLAAGVTAALAEAVARQQFFYHSAERPAVGFAWRSETGLVRSLPPAGAKLSLEIDGASAVLRFARASFAEEDVMRLAGQVEALCRSALDGGQPAFLTEEERRRLVLDFNATAAAPSNPGVLERFAAAAAAHPERLAVVYEDRRLTYRGLDEAANRLARVLRRLGVGPDVPVALCLERSAEIVVALLAVWKAGGAYVPLDVDQPRRRLEQMLADLAPPVTLVAGGLDVPTAGRVVDLLSGSLAEESGAPLAPVHHPESLAYVIFTSGSTGRPKGVGIEHRQLANYVDGAITRLDLPPGGVFATVSTFAADLGHTVIFPALVTGGTLCVVSAEIAADAERLGEAFGAHRVDCLKIVPSHLRALCEARRPEEVLPAKRLILGGEASRREWAEAIIAAKSECRVFNHYGPTETTVGVLTYPLSERGIDPRCATAPLGSPLPNVRVYVVDRETEPVAAWMPGEIVIGGAAMGRGYLGRPDLTAERFVPDPLSGEPGARLYRTGDLGRHLGSGHVEFLGRIDHQVKLHGFRVELAEIVEALRRHAQIREAVVVKVQDGDQRDLLLAYYVARQPVETAELREHLADSLPEEILPHLFVHLRRLPLTLNGKVNYDALPSLAEVREKLARQYVAPRDEREELLAAIWAEVLGLARVGIGESFFELGGHSLLATRVVSRVRQALGVDLPLRSLFEMPTVAELSQAIAAGRFASSAPSSAPIRPLKRADDPLAELEGLSDAQARELLGEPSRR